MEATASAANPILTAFWIVLLILFGCAGIATIILAAKWFIAKYDLD